MDKLQLNAALAFIRSLIDGLGRKFGDELGAFRLSIEKSVKSSFDEQQAVTRSVARTAEAVEDAMKGFGGNLVILKELQVLLRETAVELGSKTPEIAARLADVTDVLSKMGSFEVHPTDLAPVVSALASLKTDLAAIPALSRKLDEVVSAVKNIDITPVVSVEPPKLDRIEKAIANLSKSIKPTDQAAVIEAIESLKGSFKSEINFPKAFKIDENQMRQLRNANAIVLGGGGVKAATKVTMANVALTDANTEYSYTFPANTTRWTMKLRSQGVILLYAFITGTLPTSGDGSAYASVPQNFYQSEPNVEWSGKTIFLQAGTAAQTVELVSYQM